MNVRASLPWVLLAAAALISTAVQPRAQACAGVGRAGPVFVRGEEALIVWDPAQRVQHFVRRAYFDASEDFGFLVPTPSRPELAEVGSRVFNELFAMYRAPEPPQRAAAATGGGAARSRGAPAPAVVVLEERTVAGMNAAVLAANDPAALDEWLRTHQYPSGPELQAYFTPYVQAGWIITAFQIAPGGGRGQFSTAAVRMSFSTERPFFPYSEPAQDARPRRFRVSLVAPERMQGYLDRPNGGARATWRAPSYAGRPSRLARVLASVLPPQAPTGAWLTTFDEPASRRGALDLFFERAESQRAIASRITRVVRP